MDNETLNVCIIFGMIGGTFLVNFIIGRIISKIVNSINKKRHKEHPEFFRLRNEFAEKVDIKVNWYNKEISPRKYEVKSMLRDEPYWPREVREQKMEEVEKLRREIYIAECTYKGLEKETQEARQKVVEYVRKHNIKWAGD